MPHDFNVQELGQRVLATTNEIFAAGEHNIRVQMLTAEDLEWCIVQTRQQPENQRIPWVIMAFSIVMHRLYSNGLSKTQSVQIHRPRLMLHNI
ncbi:hypothetical protein [Serratia proteamaculans]|uniref:hypothetical protein n=1 Tax=Serratia proteamaculans TaxID=28151 RepID=UPI0021837111|nr:hypothetical protein [Serratia proteamaculans]CAI2526587.1 Uncharacterised protein [Serratia proteamaculans]